ncbi:MAG: lipoprotein-releasing ABC transporter permease subunit [Bdellovibrionales bacterium]
MTFKLPERLLAWRYLRTKKQEGFISLITWFSLLGIMLGVATLIIVMSVMNGFREELLTRVLGLNGHANVIGYDGPVTDYDALTASLLQVSGVTAAAPIIEAQALVTTQGQAGGALVRGVAPEDLMRRDLLVSKVTRGDMKNFEGDRIVIGARMAQRLQINVGDTLTLVSPRFAQTAFGQIPRMKGYEVAAIFDVGMYEYDNGFIFMPLPAAQAFFRLPDAVTSVEVLVENPQHIEDYLQDISAAAGSDWKVTDWQQSNRSFFTALEVERNVMFLILSLIIMVAAFNIISSLVMMVKDKGRDIAILRTMGATRGSILRIFFLAGATIGVVGTFAGLALGVAFALNIETIRQGIQALVGADLFSAEIYFLTQLPAKLDWAEVVQVTLMALGLSFAATLYPAWRAARLDPVEALRYE